MLPGRAHTRPHQRPSVTMPICDTVVAQQRFHPVDRRRGPQIVRASRAASPPGRPHAPKRQCRRARQRGLRGHRDHAGWATAPAPGHLTPATATPPIRRHHAGRSPPTCRGRPGTSSDAALVAGTIERLPCGLEVLARVDQGVFASSDGSAYPAATPASAAEWPGTDRRCRQAPAIAGATPTNLPHRLGRRLSSHHLSPAFASSGVNANTTAAAVVCGFTSA